MARAMASTTLISCGRTPSAPACRRLMSSRFSTSRISLSSDSSAVASSSSRSCVAEGDVVAAQAGDRGLGRGERGAQVVADRGEQGGAQPVGLAERAGGGGLLGEPFLAQRDRGLGGERLDHPPVGGGQRIRPHRTSDTSSSTGTSTSPCAGRRAGRSPTLAATRQASGRAGCPVWTARVGPAFEQGDAGEPERLADLFEQRRQRAAAAQHAAGHGGQGLRLGAGPGRLAGAPGGQVDDGADRDRDQRGRRPGRGGSRARRW